MILKFGKFKGRDINDVPTDYLMYLIETIDPQDEENRGKYALSNQKLIAACHTALNTKADGPSSVPVRGTGPIQTSSIDRNLKELRALIEQIYEAAAKARSEMDIFSGSNRSPY